MLLGDFESKLSEDAKQELDRFKSSGVDFCAMLGEPGTTAVSLISLQQLLCDSSLRGPMKVKEAGRHFDYETHPRVKPLTKDREYTSHTHMPDNKNNYYLTRLATSRFSASYPLDGRDIPQDCPNFSEIYGKLKSKYDFDRVPERKIRVTTKNKVANLIPFFARSSNPKVSVFQVFDPPAIRNGYEKIVFYIYGILSQQNFSRFTPDKSAFSISTQNDRMSEVAASLIATLCVTKALDFGNVKAEKIIDEALKLQICQALACSENSTNSASKIINTGLNLGVRTLSELGFTSTDIIEKDIRLGMKPITNEKTLLKALTAKKDVETYLKNYAGIHDLFTPAVVATGALYTMSAKNFEENIKKRIVKIIDKLLSLSKFSDASKNCELMCVEKILEGKKVVFTERDAKGRKVEASDLERAKEVVSKLKMAFIDPVVYSAFGKKPLLEYKDRVTVSTYNNLVDDSVKKLRYASTSEYQKRIKDYLSNGKSAFTGFSF